MSGVINGGYYGIGIVGRLPSGHIIQTEHMSHSTYISYTGTSFSTTQLTDTIIVKSPASYIMVMPSISFMAYPDAGGGWLRVDESTTSLADEICSYFGANAEETNAYAAPIYKHVHGQGVGVTLTYTIMMKVQLGSASSGIRVNDHFVDANTTYSSLLLQEIQL